MINRREPARGGRPMGRPGPRPGGMPGSPMPDIFAQFNAWQDPNIGGAQPGPISQGYGGFGALDSMSKTKMNGFLNTLSTGGQREQAMNQLGYFNGGNPYTPTMARGGNRYFRDAARSNPSTGAYSAPGTYQHMDAGGHGYTGITSIGDDGSGSYQSFAPNKNPYGRFKRRGGTTGDRLWGGDTWGM